MVVVPTYSKKFLRRGNFIRNAFANARVFFILRLSKRLCVHAQINSMIPNAIIVHHSASNINTPISEIDRWHKQRNFTKSSLGFFVGYHYVILADGKLIQTRRDNELGCHTIPNDGKIGICCVGNFMLENPTASQLQTLRVLCNRLKKDYNINEVKGHRDFSRTECPGDNLYLYVLQDKISWLKKLIETLLKTFRLHA